MNKDILWALLCNKQNKVQKQNLYILLNRYQIFKIFKTKKMKNLNLKDCGLVELNNKEMILLNGGVDCDCSSKCGCGCKNLSGGEVAGLAAGAIALTLIIITGGSIVFISAGATALGLGALAAGN